MELTQTDLAQIVEGIWSSILNMDIQPSGEEPSEPSDSSWLAARVRITGAWDGAVTLHCSPDLARRAAAAMFTMEIESVSSGEMLDSLGELVNMIGGGVKAFLPEICSLSLPLVGEGASLTPFTLGAIPVQESTFACQGEPVWVTLLKNNHKE